MTHGLLDRVGYGCLARDMVAIPSCRFTMDGVHRMGTDIPTITSQAIMGLVVDVRMPDAEPLVVTLAETERRHQVRAVTVVAVSPLRRRHVSHLRLGFQVQDAACHALKAKFSA